MERVRFLSLLIRLHLQQDSSIPRDGVHCARNLGSDNDVEDRTFRRLSPVPRLSHVLGANALVVPAWDRECHSIPMDLRDVCEVHCRDVARRGLVRRRLIVLEPSEVEASVGIGRIGR
jgi:hypothetical protein